MLASSLPSVLLPVSLQLICSMGTTGTLLQAERIDLLPLGLLLSAVCSVAALASEPAVKLQHEHS